MPSIVSEVLVGRDAELDVLREEFAQAAQGGQRAVLISGEAGIGKSRLIAEFIAELGDRAHVVVGNCLESRGMTAYGPIRQILRELPQVIGEDAFAAAVEPVSHSLAGLLPGPGGASDDLSAERVHEAVDLVFDSVSAEVPLVVVIEDLHWVDTSTLGLIGALLHYRTAGRRLLLLSYRTEDVGRGHPLRSFLGDLDRGRLATRIEPARLPREAIASLAEAIRDRPLSSDELDAIVDRGDGIPFFVEELVALADGQLPGSLREVVLARYDRMPERTQRIARILATGGDVEHRTLSAVAERLGIDSAELEECLREAVQGGLLVIAGDSYAFRHALSREAVADEVLPGERDRIHAAYAEAIEADRDPRLAAAAAGHWLAIHEIGRAFDAYLIALEDARAAYAYDSQARILEQLVELWPRVPDAAERTGMTRARTLLAAARAWHHASAVARQITLLDVAETLLEPDDRRSRGELLIARTGVALNNRRNVDGIASGTEAAAIMGEFDDPEALELRAALHANLAVVNRSDLTVNAEHAAEAVRLAELLGDPGVVAYVRVTLAISRIEFGDDRAARELLDWMRQRRVTAPENDLRAALNTVDALHRSGWFADAVDFGRESLERAKELGHPAWGSLLAANVADSAAAVGELAEADRLAQHAIANAKDPDFVCYAVRQAMRLHLLGDRSVAARELEQRHGELIASVVADSLEETAGHAVIRAELAASEGDHVGALRALSTIRDRFDDLPTSEQLFQVFATSEVIEATRAAGGDTSGAAEYLTASVDRLTPSPRHDRWRALAAAALSGGDPVAWAAAAEAMDDPEVQRWMLAPVLRHLAEARAETGDRDGAREAVTRSIEAARSIGAVRDVRLGQALAQRLGAAGAGGEGAGATGAAAAGLTAREIEVLELVAQGLSNRQIGERLYMSPKTVSVHVSAILRKLGVSGRTEAAVRAAQLLPPAPTLEA
ncbi:MAG: AAA family ATPase [Microbacteriaceae bacterium]|nr:AAA family ATPase [Microbacteriaceae bacterium]